MNPWGLVRFPREHTCGRAVLCQIEAQTPYYRSVQDKLKYYGKGISLITIALQQQKESQS
jgi:hypothetical protein